MAEHLLEIRNLSVEFHTAAGTVKAVRDVSWHLDRGETLAILGESGSGKSVSSSAIMNLIDMPPGRITSGQILFDGQDLLQLSDEARRALNGCRIAMIFQDPLAHLNPVYTVGWQIVEAMTAHGTDHATARAEALRLVTRVGIPNPQASLAKYPHEFSGGQRQRLMIAMALAMKPDVLIADEPTTALDVTVQAEVLSILDALVRDCDLAAGGQTLAIDRSDGETIARLQGDLYKNLRQLLRTMGLWRSNGWWVFLALLVNLPLVAYLPFLSPYSLRGTLFSLIPVAVVLLAPGLRRQRRQ